MALSNTPVLSSATDIYTSVGETCVVSAFFCNYSTNPVDINLFAVPSGGSATNSSIIFKSLTINASDTFILNIERIVLDDGDKLVCSASTSGAVTATVSSTSV